MMDGWLGLGLGLGLAVGLIILSTPDYPLLLSSAIAL